MWGSHIVKSMSISKVAVVTTATFITGLIFTSAIWNANVYGQGRGNKPSDVGNVATASSQANQERLRACEARREGITQRSSHLVSLVSGMESTFDSIAARVEQYYTGTVLPSGKTVPNYDSLVAKIQTEKDSVTAALNKAKEDERAFSCNSNPKAQLNQFRVDMQSVKTALKNYRTSIKNLIVAIHSVTGSEKSSPRPLASPEV
jgi:hypothetical protein